MKKPDLQGRKGLILAYFLSALTANYFFIEISFWYALLLAVGETLLCLPLIKWRKKKEGKNAKKFKKELTEKWEEHKLESNKEDLSAL